MVSLTASGLLALAIFAQGPAEATPDEAAREIGSALGKGAFPWYDIEKDAVKPIKIREEPEPPKRSSGFSMPDFVGNLIATIAFLLGLVVLIGLLVWFWRIYEPIDGPGPKSVKAQGEPERIETLPEGMGHDFESSDPWAEAIRRRGRGDLAGSVVCLFAHQLLTLSKLGLVRLAPGRTGRQLVRAVGDAEFRTLVHPTLRQFEAVYYGHRTPSIDEFASVWIAAEAFERRVSQGVIA